MAEPDDPPGARRAEPRVATSLRRRLTLGSLWVLAGSGTVQVLGVLSSVLVARLLGQDRFGEYGIIFSTIAMFGVFAGMGMGVTSTKFVAELRETDPARAGRFIGIAFVIGAASSGLLTLLILLFAEPIAQVVFGRPGLAGALRLGAPLLLLNQLATVQMASLAGLEAFGDQGRVQVWTGVLRAVLVVAGAAAFGLGGALGGLGLATLAQNVALERAIRRAALRAGVRVSFRGFRTERHALLTFSLPALLAGMSIGPPRWFCEVMLVNQPGGFAQMALLNAGNQWRNAVAFVPQQLLVVTLPVLSNLFGKGDTRRYYKTLFGGAAAVLTVSLCAVLPVAVFSRRIMAAYGEGFAAGAMVLVLLAATGALHMMGRLIVQVAHSRGRATVDLAASVFRGAVQVGLWLLWREHGALGLAAAMLASFAALDTILIVYALVQWRRDVNRPPAAAQAAVAGGASASRAVAGSIGVGP